MSASLCLLRVPATGLLASHSLEGTLHAAAGQLAQQSHQPRLGVPGVGPGPSGGSGPAYFMVQQQQQQHQHPQQQQPRLGVPGMGPGPSGGSGSGYATLGYGLGSAVHPGPPLRQRAAAAAAGGQLRPLHFQGPGPSEGPAYPPGSAGLMSISNPYGQQARPCCLTQYVLGSAGLLLPVERHIASGISQAPISNIRSLARQLPRSPCLNVDVSQLPWHGIQTVLVQLVTRFGGASAQMYGEQPGPPQLVRSSAPGPFITTSGGAPVTPAGPPNLGRYSAPGGDAAAAANAAQQQQEQAQSLAQGRTRRQPARAAATKVRDVVAVLY